MIERRSTSQPASPVEVSWFAALCDDDYEYLGVPDPALRSSWEHCKDIVLAAERNGYDNVLLPSGYALGTSPPVPEGEDRSQAGRLSSPLTKWGRGVEPKARRRGGISPRLKVPACWSPLDLVANPAAGAASAR